LPRFDRSRTTRAVGFVFAILASYEVVFGLIERAEPHWRRSATTPGGGFDTVCGLGPGDLVHGVVEAQPQDVHAKVDGIAGEVALRPPPIGVFDQESLEGRQLEVARLPFDHLESSLLEQGHQRSQARGADLVALPASAIKVADCHSLFSSGVE